MYRCGQKVICINDRGWSAIAMMNSNRIFPIKGRVYTIRQIYADDLFAKGIPFLLYEIVNDKSDNFIGYEGQLLEPGFLASRFRPVNEKKTSIDVFTAMLRPTGEMV